MTSAHDDNVPLDDGSTGEQFANAWVDGGLDDLTQPLDGAEAKRAADVALLDRLLEQALRPDPQAREIRVQRVAAAVREAVTPARPTARPARRWVATFATVAAVLMIGFFLRTAYNPQTNVTAALNTALEAAASEVDRTYQVHADLRLPSGEPRELTADLWVRGGSHYVLRQDMPLGDLYLGSNGSEHWIVPVIGPVRTGSEPGFIEQLLLREQLSMPFLQVSTLLERLADRYDLKLGPAEEIATSDGATPVWCTQVIGTKRETGDRIAPDAIHLWTARQSGVAHQVELRWNRTDEQPGLRRVVLRLQPLDEPLPADWYNHEAHHAPDRRVLRRGDSQG